MKLLTLGLVLALATPALAEDMTIDMLNKRDNDTKLQIALLKQNNVSMKKKKMD